MKIYLLILLFLASKHSFGQLTIDQNLNSQFEAEVSKFDASFQSELEDLLGNRGRGAVIFYEYLEDTLNKQQQIQRNTRFIVSDIAYEKKQTGRQSILKIPMPAFASLNGDTLSIWPAFLMLNGIEHLILKDKSVNSGYWQYAKHDSIFQESESDKLINKLRVNAKTNIFKLSSDRPVKNSWLYGFADFESAPFYIVDDNFVGKRRKMRIKAVYIFKVKT